MALVMKERIWSWLLPRKGKKGGRSRFPLRHVSASKKFDM